MDDPVQQLLKDNARELADLLGQVPSFAPQVTAAAAKISDALGAGNKLLACGNGGSAADASHLTTEFVCRFDADRRPYPAISLAAHGGDLTAIGNDYAFQDVFARQVEAFGKEGDALVVFSTSGRSENVRRALLAADKRGLITISFLGKDGGACAGLAQIEMIVPSTKTARIQEVHQLLMHAMCELIEQQL
jgi:phosphoheptose isomerase